MDEVMAIWAEWLKPSAGLPTVQWSLLLALAAAAGHLLQRYSGLPKVVGYSIVGTLAGLAGFSGAAWPLQGVALFLLELGVSVVLFESGGRIALRWFRHNPMVLLQSLAESVLTAVAVYDIKVQNYQKYTCFARAGFTCDSDLLSFSDRKVHVSQRR